MRLRSVRGLATIVLAGVLAGANAAEGVSPTRRAQALPQVPSQPRRLTRRREPQFRIRPVDDAWRASLPRDADAATQAYLDRLPADVVARSNAYFEGGYWLQLWNFLLGLAIACAPAARGRRAARVRDWCAARRPQAAFLRDALFGALYRGRALGALAAADDLPGLLSRAPVRDGDADLRPLVRRAAHRPGGEHGRRSRSSRPCSTR